jgi:hypothetical protein
VDPNGAPTSYYFEYGLSDEYGSVVPVVPAGPVGVGSGHGDVQVSQPVQGLSAGSTYHFRVVAVSQLESGVFEVMSADRTFTTQPAVRAGVADGRVWEQVSPGLKRGSLVAAIGEATPIQAAADGEAFAYLAGNPTDSEPAGLSNLTELLSVRGAGGGWSTENLTLPHAEATGASVGTGQEYRLFSSDLGLSVVQPFGSFVAGLSPEASEPTAYLHRDFGGSAREFCAESCFTPFVWAGNVPEGTEFGGQVQGKCKVIYCGPEFVGATPDLGFVALRSPVALASPKVKGGLYLWHEGVLNLVSVLPAGEGGVPVAAELGSEAQLRRVSRDAIAGDGSRVFWTAGEHLYVRDVGLGLSLRLDVSQGGSGSGGHGKPVFEGASVDGSRVFFEDQERLTGDAGAAGNEPDLYECVIVAVESGLSCSLRDLTPLAAEGRPAFVQGDIIGVSRDGAKAFFVADGALAAGAVDGGCGFGAPGGAECDLYESDEGVVSLVGVLSQDDEPDWGRGELNGLLGSVSGSGEWLSFVSERSLTGFDNLDASSGVADEEVFLFNSVSGRLVCVSCAPSGARPVGVMVGTAPRLVNGVGDWPASRWLAATVPGWTPYRVGVAVYQSRYLSGDGRLFFDSVDGLVSGDSNGNWDVYEWEPPGVGGCSEVSSGFSVVSGGCVGLVSSGEAAGESAFLDASEGGGDAFFLTSQSLVGSDTDTSRDVYDAHECTAAAPCPAAGVSEGEARACGSAETCRAGSGSGGGGVLVAPLTFSFSGPGNPAPAPAVTPRKRVVTRAQRLARALKACRKQARRKRAGCERRARKLYGAKKAAGVRGGGR